MREVSSGRVTWRSDLRRPAVAVRMKERPSVQYPRTN